MEPPRMRFGWGKVVKRDWIIRNRTDNINTINGFFFTPHPWQANRKSADNWGLANVLEPVIREQSDHGRNALS
jgi:hypothetical protein